MNALLLLLAALGAAGAAAKPSCPTPEAVVLPNLTESGYLPIDNQGSQLFFLFVERTAPGDSSAAPITLWLQGGPGCSSLFGAFYELGPQLVDDRLGLQPNPGSWGRHSALLFIDQPIGTGFSFAGGNRTTPIDELTLAADIFAGLQAFFKARPRLQGRPLAIAGESYGGKYVPSLGHFILSQAAALGGARSLGRLGPARNRAAKLATLQRRPLPPHLHLAERPLLREPPLFELRGLAIGNGLTDPAAQVMAVADTAYFQGYIDRRQRLHAMALQLEAGQLIAAGEWEAAHAMRNRLLEHVREAAGAATLLDMRRYEDYDAHKMVDCFLNLPDVQDVLGVRRGSRYEACSAVVGEALGPDVMKSVKRLLPDLLEAYPLLLYQGAHDAQDGPASNEAWVASLDWEGAWQFASAKRRIVRARDVAAADSEGRATQGTGANIATAAGSGVGGLHLRLPAQGSSESSGVAGRQAQQRRLLFREQAAMSSTEQQEWAAAAIERGGGGSSAAGHAVVAFWKQGGGLTHVVLTGAGHMAPRDAPEATQWMFERWLADALA